MKISAFQTFSQIVSWNVFGDYVVFPCNIRSSTQKKQKTVDMNQESNESGHGHNQLKHLIAFIVIYLQFMFYQILVAT